MLLSSLAGFLASFLGLTQYSQNVSAEDESDENPYVLYKEFHDHLNVKSLFNLYEFV